MPATAGSQRPAGCHEQQAALLQGMAGRDERAAAGGRLDDDGGPGEGADDAVAPRERAAVARMPGGCSLMTAPRPAICRASRRCTAGPGSSRPPPTTATRLAPGLQGGQVSGTVDAHGQPGDDRDARLREAGTDARGQAATKARGVPRADDGDQAGRDQARRRPSPKMTGGGSSSSCRLAG